MVKNRNKYGFGGLLRGIRTYLDTSQVRSNLTNENRKTRWKMSRLSRMFRFLCMHKIFMHAQHSCACTTLLCMHRNQAWDPKMALGRSQALDRSLVRGLVPVHAHECCACTRVLCLHKNLVHAQESCACTRILTCWQVLIFFDFCFNSSIWPGIYPDMFV